jgi:CPA2 family monovalent cation:H+ antiporter-2
MLGLSPILGTFIAGMLLAETPFADQIRADVTPMRAIFVTVFFASVGMLVKVPTGREALMAVAFAVAIVAGKALVIAAVVRPFRQQAHPSWRAAFSLAQIGEFSFVIAELAHKNELISDSTFQVLLSASLLTLLATPYLIGFAPKLAGWLTRSAGTRVPKDLAAGASEKRVVVVGLGPAGREVVQALQERGYPVFVLELNPGTVAANRSQLPIGLGDATQRDILDHVRLADAAALVVTIPDPHAARQIVRQARAAAPDLPIMVRARQHVHAAPLSQAGATQVFDEEYLMGRRMAGRVVESLQPEKQS